MARENYPIPDKPVYTEELPQLVNSDPANAEDILNPQFLAAHSNIKAVKLLADAAQAKAEEAQQSAGQAGASSVPLTRKVNGQPLTGDISLNAGDVGARPDTWTPTAAEVGARPITWTPTAAEVGARPANWTPNAAEVGAVPTGRTVNGKPLSSNIALAATDVSARPSNWTPTAAEVGAVPAARKVNNKALSADISLTAADVGALATSTRGASNGVAPLTSGKIPASYLPASANWITWTKLGSRTLQNKTYKYEEPIESFCSCGSYDFVLIKFVISAGVRAGNDELDFVINMSSYNTIGVLHLDRDATTDARTVTHLFWRGYEYYEQNAAYPAMTFYYPGSVQKPDALIAYAGSTRASTATLYGTITQEVYGGKLLL